MFNIAIAQSGGPTAAINASLTGVFNGAEACPDIDEIYGAENGIEGILGDRLLNLRNILMDEHDKQLLMNVFDVLNGQRFHRCFQHKVCTLNMVPHFD